MLNAIIGFLVGVIVGIGIMALFSINRYEKDDDFYDGGIVWKN